MTVPTIDQWEYEDHGGFEEWTRDALLIQRATAGVDPLPRTPQSLPRRRPHERDGRLDRGCEKRVCGRASPPPLPEAIVAATGAHGVSAGNDRGDLRRTRGPAQLSEHRRVAGARWAEGGPQFARKCDSMPDDSGTCARRSDGPTRASR